MFDDMLNKGLRKYYDEQELFRPPMRSVGTQTTPHCVFPDEPSSSTTVFVPSPPAHADSDDHGFPRARSDNDSTEADYSLFETSC